jgi:hypothetical protein
MTNSLLINNTDAIPITTQCALGEIYFPLLPFHLNRLSTPTAIKTLFGYLFPTLRAKERR